MDTRITRPSHSSIRAEAAAVPVPPSHAGRLLTVSFGQATFDAEGTEAPGRFFSRTIHYPGGPSGVTIGRGYDMGARSPAQIRRELTAAGVAAADAARYASAAGLRGVNAGAFVEQSRHSFPVLSLEAQKRLFEEVVTPPIIDDIKRIFSKADVVEAYGEASWDSLGAAARELVFDLRYRGDYTPAIRRILQEALVANDDRALEKIVSNRALWRGLGVPEDRIERRIRIFSR